MKMKVRPCWTPQEVALRGYAEGLRVLKLRPGDSATLRVTNATLVGYLHRRDRVRSPWIARAWVNLFELIAGLDGVSVDLLTREGQRSQWRAA